MEDIKCISCNKNFERRSSAHKICDKCKIKKCGNCGKSFEIKARGKRFSIIKYCSRKCYLESRFDSKKCKQCGKPCNYNFCSEKCRKTYWNTNTKYKLRKKNNLWQRKKEIIKKLGSKCEICGNEDYRVLDIDHKDKSKKKMTRNEKTSLQKRVIEWGKNLDNLRILCANCHRIRTWEQMGYGNGVH